MTKRWFSPFLRGKIILPRFFVIGITCFADIENASAVCRVPLNQRQPERMPPLKEWYFRDMDALADKLSGLCLFHP
jgi:hypothetical protein